MNRIRTTANVATTENTTGVYQRWMRTFGSTAAPGDCNDPDVDPNQYGLACPRPPELKLARVDPFAASATTTFQPVAVFNRFDLAPSNGAHCGEYRVVYAMTSSALAGRAFVIFEAALPNPNPAAGISACLPVAQFWQGLTADTSATSRAIKLENFYFKGTAVAGFAPVVQAAHYGLSTGSATHGAGQIRTNFFIDFAKWHLREFKLNRACTNAADPQTCQLAFDHVTVKANSADELFAGTHANAPAFRSAFTSKMGSLLSTDVASIGLVVADRFDEFESVSQDTKVLYSSLSDAAMRSAVQAKLTALGSTLTVNNALDRATTQTCAGCHQVSNGQPLGGGKTWPSSLGFVQVDETSQLSAALIGTFLPHRKVVLEKFINDRCTGAAPSSVDADVTVGGGAVGAPN